MLTLCEFNVENLFLSMAYYEGKPIEEISESQWTNLALSQFQKLQKPQKKLWALAKTLQEIQPDIVMMVEVGGEESLQNFNRHFLADAYDLYFVEGNARRGIDLAFLVNRNLGLPVEARSNRDLQVEVSTWLGKEKAVFSRDIAELRLSNAKGGLILILLLVHLKSKLGSGGDVGGKDLRTAEAFALSEYYEKLRLAYPDVPIVVGGDLNEELSSLDLARLQHTDLTDFHEVLGTPREDRISYVHYDYYGIPQPKVIDYLLISPHLVDCIVHEKSATYRYRGHYGERELLPTTRKERSMLPSDHYPVVLTFRIEMS